MRGRCLLAMSSSPSNQCLPCVTRQVTYAEYRQACCYFLPLNQLHQFNQRMLHIDLVNQLSLKQITVFRMLCFWSHFYSQICKESGRYYLIYCKFKVEKCIFILNNQCIENYSRSTTSFLSFDIYCICNRTK